MRAGAAPKEPPQNVVGSASYDLAVDTEIIRLTRRPPVALVDTWSATEHVSSRTTQQHIVAPVPVATAWKDRSRISLAVLELAVAVVARPTIDHVITTPPSDAVTALAAADLRRVTPASVDLLLREPVSASVERLPQ